jgi:hypothetical protein
MRYIIAIVFASANIAGYAQSDVRVGLYAEITESFRDFTSPKGDYLDNYQTPVHAINGGLYVDYSLNKSVRFATGLGYARMGFDMKSMVVPSSFHYLREYLKIPVELHYHFLHLRKFSIGLGGGFSGNFLVKASVTTFDELKPDYLGTTGSGGIPTPPSAFEYKATGSELKDRGFRRSNVGLTGKLLITFAATSRLTLTASPMFEYFLYESRGDFDVEREHLYAKGLRVMCVCRIN